MNRALLALLAVTMLVGCIDDLTPATLVDKNRVLAARVEVEGMPANARPLPGQRATVRFFVVNPASWQPLTYEMAALPAFVAPTGDAIPVGLPFSTARVTDAITTPLQPELSFEIPAALVPSADSVLVAGVFCGDAGDPVVNLMDLEASRCSESEERKGQSLVRFTFPLGTEQGNDNPTFDGATLTLALPDGGTQVTWEPPTVDLEPGAPCATTPDGPAFPRVSRLSGGEREVEITPSPGDRQSYEDDEGQARTENLVFSHVTTMGEFDDQFSVVDGLSVTAGATFTLPATTDIPAGGITVAHHFVVRDGRGGVDWTTRLLCAVP